MKTLPFLLIVLTSAALLPVVALAQSDSSAASQQPAAAAASGNGSSSTSSGAPAPDSGASSKGAKPEHQASTQTQGKPSDSSQAGLSAVEEPNRRATRGHLSTRNSPSTLLKQRHQTHPAELSNPSLATRPSPSAKPQNTPGKLLAQPEPGHSTAPALARPVPSSAANHVPSIAPANSPLATAALHPLASPKVGSAVVAGSTFSSASKGTSSLNGSALKRRF